MKFLAECTYVYMVLVKTKPYIIEYYIVLVKPKPYIIRIRKELKKPSLKQTKQ
jgi:hypothetical protein